MVRVRVLTRGHFGLGRSGFTGKHLNHTYSVRILKEYVFVSSHMFPWQLEEQSLK